MFPVLLSSIAFWLKDIQQILYFLLWDPVYVGSFHNLILDFLLVARPAIKLTLAISKAKFDIWVCYDITKYVAKA